MSVWQPLTAPEPEPVFARYRELLRQQATLKPSEWTFKNNPIYQQFLEHVTDAQGARYLEIMQQDFPEEWAQHKELFARTAQENNNLGRAGNITGSPTNLRYMQHALTFWRHVNSLGLRGVHAIEIGGGYGGLALYIRRLAPSQPTILRTYTIVDVPEAGPIQAAYAREMAIPLRTVDGTDAQEIEAAINATRSAPRVLVSAYGFSEFSAEVRAWYEALVIPHCSHGWLVWNGPPVYPFTPAPLTVEPEHPSTGRDNAVVTF